MTVEEMIKQRNKKLDKIYFLFKWSNKSKYEIVCYEISCIKERIVKRKDIEKKIFIKTDEKEKNLINNDNYQIFEITYIISDETPKSIRNKYKQILSFYPKNISDVKNLEKYINDTDHNIIIMNSIRYVHRYNESNTALLYGATTYDEAKLLAEIL